MMQPWNKLVLGVTNGYGLRVLVGRIFQEYALHLVRSSAGDSIKQEMCNFSKKHAFFL